MTDEDAEPDDNTEGPTASPWDAVEVLRARAVASRALRDEAINELRESMTDEEVGEDFGLDLRELGSD